MLLRAGLLLVFLVTVHAQPPRSPVLAAISASSQAPLPDLIKTLDAAGKTGALARPTPILSLGRWISMIMAHNPLSL